MNRYDFVPFDVIAPMHSITKLGAGIKLMAIAKVDGEYKLVRSDFLTLHDVVALRDAGINIIEIKED